MSFTLFGLTLGEDSGYEVERFSGLDSADVRTDTVLLPQNHGGVATDQWAGIREVALELRVFGDTQADAHSKARALSAALQPRQTDGEFTWQLPGQDEVSTLFCRPAGLSTVWVSTLQVFDARVVLEAADPAIYGPLTQTQVDPYALSGGLTFPVTYPKVYGDAGSGGGVTVSNGGNWPSWPKFIIGGPTSGAVNVLAIEDATNGESIEFTADGGLTVSEGSTLVVDTHPARRLVQFTSGADRLSTVVDLDSWFSIPAGDSEIRFRASGDTAGATLTTELRSAWL